MDAAVKAYQATTNQASRDDLIIDHIGEVKNILGRVMACLLYTSPSPRDQRGSRMPSSA